MKMALTLNSRRLSPRTSMEQSGDGAEGHIKNNNASRQLTSPTTRYGQFDCRHCNKTFWSDDSLRKHLGTHPAEKAFTCEICNKSFRFRSNLAEHRSVHTALKPYVCKYCGKSSRLKGNLTKHILKHHKNEQNAFLSKEPEPKSARPSWPSINKKNVKDPASVDFIESSMIVIAEHERKPFSTTPKSSVQITTASLDNNNEGRVSQSEQQRSETASSNQSHGWLDALATSFHGGSVPGTPPVDVNPLVAAAAVGNAVPATLFSLLGAHLNAADFANQNLLLNGGGLTNGGSSMDEEMSGDDSEMLPVETAGRNGDMGNVKNETTSSPDVASAHSGGTPTSSGQAVPNTGTKCHLCQKHFRKGRNLNIHMTLKHGYPPIDDDSEHEPLPAGAIPQQFDVESNKKSPPTSPTNGGPPPLKYAPTTATRSTPTSSHIVNGMTNELNSLKQQLRQMPSETSPTTQQHNKLELMINSMDERVTRLEKQVETVLTTMYTLVQLQTGMNQTLQRFKEDANRQLRHINQMVTATVDGEVDEDVADNVR